MNFTAYLLRQEFGQFNDDFIDRSDFREVSQPALERLEQVKKMTTKHDFTTDPVLNIAPKYHLVEHCWSLFYRWCKDKGLLAKRTRLTDHEIKTRTPKQTRRGIYIYIYIYIQLCIINKTSICIHKSAYIHVI